MLYLAVSESLICMAKVIAHAPGLTKSCPPLHRGRAKALAHLTELPGGTPITLPKHDHLPSPACSRGAPRTMKEVRRVSRRVQDEYVGHTRIKVEATHEERGTHQDTRRLALRLSSSYCFLFASRK